MEISSVKAENQAELIIFVKLGQGEFPCLGATVICEVTRPLSDERVEGTERAAEDTVFVKLYRESKSICRVNYLTACSYDLINYLIFY